MNNQIAYSDDCEDWRAVVYDVGRYELQLCSKHAAVDDLLEAVQAIILLVKYNDECDIDFTGMCDCLYDYAMKQVLPLLP